MLLMMVRGGRRGGEEMGELELIRRIRARAPGRSTGRGLVLGIGDDCALLRVRPGEEIAVTTDLSIEGRHFRMEWHKPEEVGHRTLARGLSDLAAMGARPVAAFVSLGLWREMDKREQWVSRFYDGLLKLATEFDTPLAGGDLAESPVVLADVMLVGAVAWGKALRRSGARAGDAIYVTGELGGAAAGLEKLARTAGKRGRRAEELHAHLYPEPRVKQGLWLVRRGAATAAIDLSDGLSTDLGHVCEESGLEAEVDEAALPIAPGATLEQALNGGEDYELLFTAAEGTRIPRAIAGARVTRIGRMVRRRKGRALITLKNADGGLRAMEGRGWEHLA